MLTEEDLLPPILPLDLADALLAKARKDAGTSSDTEAFHLTSPIDQETFLLCPVGKEQFEMVIFDDLPAGKRARYASRREAALSLALQIISWTRSDPNAEMRLKYFIHAHNPT
jgi:hypothetical protein